mgnify:CR=1 FL=1
MLAESTLFVLVQYVAQAVLALVIVLLLRRFYADSDRRGFRAWSWSWLALMIHMIGSAVSLWNIQHFHGEHPFRLGVSILTIAASLLQVFWLYAGAFELAYNRSVKFSSKRWALVFAILISTILVFAYAYDPAAGTVRVFLRVGVRSLVVGTFYIICAIMVYRFIKTGIGIKFILVAFLFYGLQQLNYGIASFFFLNGWQYPFILPFYMGSLDVALQAVMGLGMIINLLEMERMNLQKANNELDTFLYRSSHDLRAPLTTILGVVDILKRERDSKENADRYIDYILDRVLKADSVINDIIHLRRGQKSQVQPVEINVNELLEEFIRRYETLWSGRIRFERDYDQSATIRSDVDRLSVALDNVLTNAMAYRRAEHNDSWIRLKTKRTQEGLIVSIIDNGQGIAEKHLTRIFDMFYRANMQSEGSGLGLYMVKDALSDINSTIDVHSEVGVGTTFRLLIRQLV